MTPSQEADAANNRKPLQPCPRPVRAPPLVALLAAVLRQNQRRDDEAFVRSGTAITKDMGVHSRENDHPWFAADPADAAIQGGLSSAVLLLRDDVSGLWRQTGRTRGLRVKHQTKGEQNPHSPSLNIN